MKAITVWQPWASLIAVGAKPYEFRAWPIPKFLIGRRVAIHAGARRIKAAEIRALVIKLKGGEPWSACLIADKALPLLERLLCAEATAPLASVLCTVVLGEPIRADRVLDRFGGPVANDSDRDEHFNWAWPCSEVELLEPFAPAKGAQGFWEWRP